MLLLAVCLFVCCDYWPFWSMTNIMMIDTGMIIIHFFSLDKQYFWQTHKKNNQSITTTTTGLCLVQWNNHQLFFFWMDNNWIYMKHYLSIHLSMYWWWWWFDWHEYIEIYVMIMAPNKYFNLKFLQRCANIDQIIIIIILVKMVKDACV